MFGGSGSLAGLGVSFQPASASQDQADRNEAALGGRGVQEAIKILSLRMPRVVGAQGALAPAPLLHSQGSGGNPRVDSVLERAWAKIFPTTGPDFYRPPAPMLPSGGDERVGKMPPNPPFGVPVRHAPSVDRVPLPPRPPTPPRFVPGGEPSPPRRNPIDEIPLPAPPPPSIPSPSNDFDAALRGYPNRFDI